MAADRLRAQATDVQAQDACLRRGRGGGRWTTDQYRIVSGARLLLSCCLGKKHGMLPSSVPDEPANIWN